MATVIINDKTEKGKSLLNFLRTNFEGENFISFIHEKKLKKEVFEALDEIKKGRGKEYDSVNEMISDLKKKHSV